VFENNVLRRKFESKAEKVTGGWRELGNEEVYNLFTFDQILLG
jgi:hypothetical protein